MRRQTIFIIGAGVFLGLALVAGGIALLLKTGFVSVESNLSSGEANDSADPKMAVGYEGRTAPEKTTIAAMTKRDLGRVGGPPNLLLAPNTRVKVVIVDPDAAQVLVLEGKAHGRTPWIHWNDLR